MTNPRIVPKYHPELLTSLKPAQHDTRFQVNYDAQIQSEMKHPSNMSDDDLIKYRDHVIMLQLQHPNDDRYSVLLLMADKELEKRGLMNSPVPAPQETEETPPQQAEETQPTTPVNKEPSRQTSPMPKERIVNDELAPQRAGQQLDIMS